MNTSSTDKDLNPNCLSFIANAMEIKQKNPDKFRSVFLVDFPRIVSCPVSNKFGWWVCFPDTSKFNIPKLKLFHFLLFHHKYISCSYEVFEQHFIGNEITKEKIVWEGDVMVFVLLFYKLIYEKGVIAPTTESYYHLIFNHFELLNKKNNYVEELKKGSLKSSLSKARSNATVCKIAENFITLLIG